MGYYDDEYYDPYYDYYMHTGEFSEYFEDSDDVYDDEYLGEDYDEIVDGIEGEFAEDIGEAVYEENDELDISDDDESEGVNMDADDGFKQLNAQLDAVIYQLKAQIREKERLAKSQKKPPANKGNSRNISVTTPSAHQSVQTGSVSSGATLSEHTHIKALNTQSTPPTTQSLSFWQRLKCLFSKESTPKN